MVFYFLLEHLRFSREYGFRHFNALLSSTIRYFEITDAGTRSLYFPAIAHYDGAFLTPVCIKLARLWEDITVCPAEHTFTILDRTGFVLQFDVEHERLENCMSTISGHTS